jgi:membrane associated rhomboid family serine protease
VVFPLRTNVPGYAAPLVTLILIFINCAVYVVELMSGSLGETGSAFQTWGVMPARVWSGDNIPGTSLSAWWTTLTAMFVHAGLGHLMGNLMILWLFGSSLEWLCGRWRYLVLYLGSGILGSIFVLALGYSGTMGGAGASGAVAGIMLAFLLVYPRAKVSSWCFLSIVNLFTLKIGPIIRNISVYWFVGFWVFIESWKMLGILLLAGHDLPAGAFAHVGGAVGGGLLIWPLLIPERRPAADHHTQVGDLTMIIIGDEGDAGHSSQLPEEDRQLAWELSSAGRLQQRIRHLRTPFKDAIADRLFESGDLAGVRMHCTEMLELARKDMNEARVEAYTALLEEVAQREHEARLHQEELARAEQVRSTLKAPRTPAPYSSAPKNTAFGVSEDVGRGTRRR